MKFLHDGKCFLEHLYLATILQKPFLLTAMKYLFYSIKIKYRSERFFLNFREAAFLKTALVL